MLGHAGEGEDGWVGIRPDADPDVDAAAELQPPGITFVSVLETKAVKNRVHLDVTPVGVSQADEVDRLLALGATYADIGQGEVRWVVLATRKATSSAASTAPGRRRGWPKLGLARHGRPGVEAADDRVRAVQGFLGRSLLQHLAHRRRDGGQESQADHDGQPSTHGERVVRPVACPAVPILRSIAPILPTADMARTKEHYEQLGFAVRVHQGGYGTASRDGINLHFHLIAPGEVRQAGAVYLAVDDADALHAEWAQVGQTSDLFDPGFGVWEAAHTDPDGNLIRFGSPVPGDNVP